MSRPLYGDTDRHAEEPGDSGVLSATLSGWEGEDVGVNGPHAQTAHHSQCDVKVWNTVASGR